MAGVYGGSSSAGVARNMTRRQLFGGAWRVAATMSLMLMTRGPRSSSNIFLYVSYGPSAHHVCCASDEITTGDDADGVAWRDE